MKDYFMYPMVKVFGLTVLASIVFTGCASSYYTPVTEPFTSNVENQIQDNIDYGKKLQETVNKTFPDNRVKVVADHFNVLVVGQVKDQQAKEDLVQFIKEQHDTREVFDYVTVNYKPSLNYSSSLVSKVQDRLVEEQDIDANKVTVAAVDGVVYLLGTNIGNLTHLARAVVGIYTIDGVTKVINLVKPGPVDYYSAPSANR